MLIQHAKALARQWVISEARHIPGFHGGYFAGSANWLLDTAILPATSDLDINVVLSGPNERHARGKFVYRDVLLVAGLQNPTVWCVRALSILTLHQQC